VLRSAMTPAPSVRIQRGFALPLRAAMTPPDSVTSPSRLLGNPSTRAGGAHGRAGRFRRLQPLTDSLIERTSKEQLADVVLLLALNRG